MLSRGALAYSVRAVWCRHGRAYAPRTLLTPLLVHAPTRELQ